MRDNITTIDWYTLPRNGNGGAAFVSWHASTTDTQFPYDRYPQASICYLVGAKPPRYPLPALRECAWCAAPPPTDHEGWHEFCTWNGCPFN